MFKKYRYPILVVALLAATAVPSFGQEAELLAVLRSDADIAKKSAACRQLARVATKESVPTLAGLLGDEKLSHMARYALEGIRDPSVDEALRGSLEKVHGRPLLGVIGSIGVRRDGKAVDALAGLLKQSETAASTARALGNIGTPAAAQALENAMPAATGNDRLAIAEGLLRCAEALAKEGQNGKAQGVYDSLRGVANMPHQVRTAALRGAILSRGKDGIPILVEALHNSDYTQAAAATRSAMELPGPEVGDALLAELPKTPSDRQGLVILVLADRHDSRILPVVLKLAKGSDAQLRVVAFRAMKQVGDASCVPALLDAAATGSDEVAKAAVESLESLQDKSVDAQLTAKLSESQGKLRMVLIELVGRRRAVAATAALWQAADDSDPAVRAAALTSLGAVADATALPKLLARMGNTKDDREAAALDKGVNAVCLRSKDPDVVASQLATALPTASQPTKVKILDQLNAVGGGVALKAVAAAARSDNAELQDAAFRVLGKWKRVDAAPVLLELHNGVADSRFKTRAIRAYIRIARQFDMAADRRAEMCRTALETAQRDDDKRLVLEILLRYPNDAMKAIAEQAAKNPALKDEASLVLMGMSSKGVDRAELGRALAQAGHTPVKLEIVKAEYGADKNIQDVTASLQKYAKNCRVIFLPSVSYNESFGGDPAPGTQKRLHIQYRINGKDAEVTLVENVTIILPLPK